MELNQTDQILKAMKSNQTKLKFTVQFGSVLQVQMAWFDLKFSWIEKNGLVYVFTYPNCESL